MSKELAIQLSPEESLNQEVIKIEIGKKLNLKSTDKFEFKLLKRSVDARQRRVKINLYFRVFLEGESDDSVVPKTIYPDVSKEDSVLIIGAGPAGLFAALKLIEQGIKPVIIERGKNVRDRRRDLVSITRNEKVDVDSNYCFGEGGAGTYSDGKLYTRSGNKKRIKEILNRFVEFGADENILINSHPHIGTNKLPNIIQNMRELILSKGGEIHFGERVVEILKNEDSILGVKTKEGKVFNASDLILATGHSARDIFYYLNENKFDLEFKSFALGVRVEHPQSFIDQQQYRCEERGEFLDPAAYSLVTQIGDKGVYSFCMCPGGIMAPCATEQEEVVTNGWSPSKRNNPFANSGIVTQVEWEDIPEYHYHKALAGLEFQKYVERTCWQDAGGTQHAPAQLLEDFVSKRDSDELPECSYKPGVTPSRLDKILPRFIVDRLTRGFLDFEKKMKGFIHKQAIVVAPESRTSSPIRIPRNKETLESTQFKGFYPCGEGAGYAGGIVSAAIDGENVADKIAQKKLHKN